MTKEYQDGPEKKNQLKGKMGLKGIFLYFFLFFFCALDLTRWYIDNVDNLACLPCRYGRLREWKFNLLFVSLQWLLLVLVWSREVLHVFLLFLLLHATLASHIVSFIFFCVQWKKQWTWADSRIISITGVSIRWQHLLENCCISMILFLGIHLRNHKGPMYFPIKMEEHTCIHKKTQSWSKLWRLKIA